MSFHPLPQSIALEGSHAQLRGVHDPVPPWGLPSPVQLGACAASGVSPGPSHPVGVPGSMRSEARCCGCVPAAVGSRALHSHGHTCTCPRSGHEFLTSQLSSRTALTAGLALLQGSLDAYITPVCSWEIGLVPGQKAQIPRSPPGLPSCSVTVGFLPLQLAGHCFSLANELGLGLKHLHKTPG